MPAGLVGWTCPSESTAVTEATRSLAHRLTPGPRGSSGPTRPLSPWACSQGLRTSSRASPGWWAGEVGPRRLSPGLRTSPGPGP